MLKILLVLSCLLLGACTPTVNIVDFAGQKSLQSQSVAYSFVFTNGDAITTITPAFSSGIVGATIIPDITADTGLIFNSHTGEISGTPTTNISPTTYTLTATLTNGATGTGSINLTVVSPPSISLTATPLKFTNGTGITSVVPTLGSSVLSVSISPDLTADTGLTFNTTTGVISGTPAIDHSATTYTLTAINAAGKTLSTTISIGVYALPTIASVIGSPFVFINGVEITAITPTLGSSVTTVSIDPDITSDTGLTFTGALGMISGTPTIDQTATTYTLTASNAAGATASTTISVSIITPAILSIATTVVPSTVLGGTSGEITFTVTNTGGYLATLTNRLLGTGTQYAIVGGTCTVSSTLAVGATCTLSVTFSPTSVGTKSDMLTLAYGNGISNQTATLNISGNVCDPAGYPYGGGSGTSGSPFLICAVPHLENINIGPWNSGSDGNYELTSDLDLTGIELNLELAGNFDGKNHSISNLTDMSGSTRGLFNQASGSIHHLTISNFLLDTYLYSNNEMGALVGTNSATIHDVLVVNSRVSGNSYVGGLAGINTGNISLSQVTFGLITGDTDVGGLVGYNNGGTVTTSSSSASVEGDNYGGGLVGMNEGTISDSYAGGSVAAVPVYTWAGIVAGLVGGNNGGTITRTYASGELSDPQGIAWYVPLSGLTGEDNGTTIHSYWDFGSTGTGDSASGTALSTTAMKIAANFISWDFTTIWKISSGERPTLRVNFATPPRATSETITTTPPTGLPIILHASETNGLAVTFSITVPPTRGTLSALAGNSLTYTPTGGYNGYTDAFTFSVTNANGTTSGVITINVNATCPTTISGLTPGGTGTAANPHHLTNATELNMVRDYLYCSFTLDNNIDLAGVSFAPIGNHNSPFRGKFSGNNHEISNWTYSNTSSWYVGFFGGIAGATITDLGITNVNLNAPYAQRVGALVGDANGGWIKRSYSSGSVTGGSMVGGLVGGASIILYGCHSSATVTGDSAVGGLIGISGHINYSYATGNVFGGNYAGGLVGTLDYGGELTNSYATGNVSGSVSVGGLVGKTYGNTLANSYATGNVSGTSEVGGLTGTLILAGPSPSAFNNYSSGLVTGTTDVGGLSGSGTAACTSCYWNTQTSGRSTSTSGVGKTTAELQTQSTFTGWDFDLYWFPPVSSTSYPTLHLAPIEE